MPRHLVLAALAVGCGRVDFDTRTPCVPVGHDEDGDGVDDACDVCPHLADDQRDRDGDGVGDACDPQPAPTEAITFFDPFLEPLPEWILSGDETYTGDQVQMLGTVASLSEQLVEPPGRDTFTAVGYVHGFAGSPDHQLSLQVANAAHHGSYYCELYEDTAFYLAATYTYDDASYHFIDMAPIPLGFHDGDAMLTLELAPPDITCRATWAGTSYTVSGPIPSGLPADAIFVAVNRFDFDMRSFIRIRTSP